MRLGEAASGFGEEPVQGSGPGVGRKARSQLCLQLCSGWMLSFDFEQGLDRQGKIPQRRAGVFAQEAGKSQSMESGASSGRGESRAF